MDSANQETRAVLVSLARHFSRPAEPLLFDVGAHRGSSIDLLLDIFPRATIHSFEPDPTIFEGLSARCAGEVRVTPHRLGLGAAVGQLQFNANRLGDNDGIGSFLPLGPRSGAETVATHTVDVTTLDAFCASHAIPAIDLLKIDVQGFEAEVLRGAQRMLEARRIGVVQIEIIFFPFYQRQLSFLEVETLLIPHGYRLFTLENLWKTQEKQLFQLDAFYVGPDRLAG